MYIIKLLEQFELLRNEMNEIGKKYGLTHPKVLHKSKELDKLHIKILNLQSEKKTSHKSLPTKQ